MEQHKVNIEIITINFSDDNMLCVGMWFEFFGGLL